MVTFQVAREIGLGDSSRHTNLDYCSRIPFRSVEDAQPMHDATTTAVFLQESSQQAPYVAHDYTPDAININFEEHRV